MNPKPHLSIQLTSLNHCFFQLLDRERKRALSAIILTLSLVLLLCSIPREARAASMTFTTDTTLTEDATIAAGETWTVNFGITLTINENVTVTLEEENSLIDNLGTIQNSGTLNNVEGAIRNSGDILNAAKGIIFNSFEATIDNTFGIIINKGFVNNFESTISNSQNGVIENANTIRNSEGAINNSGLIDNTSEGIINNDIGLIENNVQGTIENTGVINNWEGSTIDNAGRINNEGIIKNAFVINNDCGGILAGTIPTSGNPIIDRCYPDMPEGFRVTNLGITSSPEITGNLTVFRVSEFEGKRDLNDDGDINDWVVHLYNISTDIITNLRLAGDALIVGDMVALGVSETFQGNTDLNDDGDTNDVVFHMYDPSTGILKNLKFAENGLRAVGTSVLIEVDESRNGNPDLNGDGDTRDVVLHVYNPVTDSITNLKFAKDPFSVKVAGTFAIFEVNESDQGNTDLNDDGDADDRRIVHVYDTSMGVTTNLKLAATSSRVVETFAIIEVSESDQGNTDLNDDGDTGDLVAHVYDFATGMTTNLKLSSFFSIKVDGTSVVIVVNESDQGNTDLNDDGDTDDRIVHVYDAGTGITTNLKLAGDGRVDGNLVAINVRESDQGNTDLNNDGDANDSVLHAYDAGTGMTTNLKLAALGTPKVAGNLIVFDVHESRRSNIDLNDDGDTDDRIIHIYDASTRITTNLKLDMTDEPIVAGNLVAFTVSEDGQGNTDRNDDGDTDDKVATVYDASMGTITNLKLAGSLNKNESIDGNFVIISVFEFSHGKTDLNDDGDAGDDVIHVYNSSTGLTTNLKLAVRRVEPTFSQNLALIFVSESRQGKIDLDNDGFTRDDVLHIVRIGGTPPVFDNISDITQEATGPDGAIVEYPFPRVTDDTDPNPAVSCEPASGALFALGATKVICTAIDSDGNEATTSFTVNVVSEIEALLTFTSIADATIKLDSATENFGAANKLNADMNPGQDILMKFDVSGIGTRRVQSVTLRLFCTNKSDQGGEFHQADNNWSEDTVTWENAPLAERKVIASPGPVARFTWVEVDLTSLITEDGVYSLRVMSVSNDGVDYRSKEKPEFAPELVITFQDTLTFTPIADATIKLGLPTENFGAINTVRTGNRPLEDFLMKFDVSGIGARPVRNATLHLFCTNKSDLGGEFHQTDNDWSEDTVTWDTAPLADREVIASLGPVFRFTWAEVDLTSLITEDGIYSLRVMSLSDDGVVYRSREKPGLEPELILTLE